jgi:DNA polymerase-3 subunit gamma/tau
MSKFIVSARKYRPNMFKDVVGQQHVTHVLKQALSTGKVAQAFLFTGPRGVGKTTCARILAKTLNCLNPREDFEPCNECNSCESFTNNASFNITELDAASNNGVEHIRSLIEQVRFQPQQGKSKVFIIDEVHMLSLPAFNAFLKTLEEPPSYAYFILATTEKHKIIPTILSRCQIYDFKRIQVKDIVQHLQMLCEKEGLKADDDALHLIAQKADGALRDALSIFDRISSLSKGHITLEVVTTNLNILDYDYYFKVIDHLLLADTSNILLTFNDIVSRGFEPDIFLLGLAEHVRNLLVAKEKATQPLLEVSEKLAKKYIQQSENSSQTFLLNALHYLNECDVNFKMAKNKKLHIELYLIKVAHINQAVQVQLNGPTPVAEKKTLDQSPIISAPIAEPASTNKKEKETKETKEAKEAKITSTAASTNTASQVVAEPIETIKKAEPASTSTAQKSNTPNPAVAAKAVSGLKSKLSGLKKLSLDSITESVIEKDQEEKSVVKKELTLENLTEAWTKYSENVESNSVRTTLLDTELSIVDGAIISKVGSKVAAGHLQEEDNLMQYLRTYFGDAGLKRMIEVDASRMEEHQKAQKVLNPKEIFTKFCEKNPLIEKFTKDLDFYPNM